MLSEEQIRRDLEKTARQIVSRKTWPILDAAIFLGYSRNHMDLLAMQKDMRIIRVGGKKHLYAVEILELFEEQNEMDFPILREQWFELFKIG